MAKEPSKRSEEALGKALIMASPGTMLREAISFILQSRMGALVCIGDPKLLSEISEGGVKLDQPCTSQLLFELCKMDGAIILNKNASRILFANRFLKPDNSIPSPETGTRHRIAQRVAKQGKCVVVAVSERRSSVTLYVHDIKHSMDTISTLLNKASQSIQTLEKYIGVLNQALRDLTAREFQDMVTIFDVCKTIQHYEMVVRSAKEIEPYIIELGTEGRLIEIQLKELVSSLEEAEFVVKDYHRDKSKNGLKNVNAKLADISEDELLNLSSISQALGHGQNLRSIDTYLSPRGYRVLTKTNRLTPQLIENLIERFSNLQQIIRAPKEELVAVDGVGEVYAERVRASLNLLRNQLALDRR